MDWKTVGNAAAASGWRGRVADAVEGPAHRSRVPVRGDQVRALLGFLFLGMSLAYLMKVGRRIARA
ncbi:MAG TPA: hypothetical protein VFN93_08925 [Gaiellaceae bacterium]|nr:hypothetical protein [Gaiellaceae bacterium]